MVEKGPLVFGAHERLKGVAVASLCCARDMAGEHLPLSLDALSFASGTEKGCRTSRCSQSAKEFQVPLVHLPTHARHSGDPGVRRSNTSRQTRVSRYTFSYQ
jgi:hypothetical protein